MSQQSNTHGGAQQQDAERRRLSILVILIGVGIAAVVLTGLLILMSLQGGGVEEADYSGLTQSVDQSYGGFAYALGDPDAPVTLVDYSDFTCSHCRDFTSVVHGLIDDYVRDGRLRVVYVPLSFLARGAGQPAAVAMVCAGEQGKAWEMHDRIWALGSASTFNRATFISRALDLGLNVDQFAACYDSPETIAAVQQINTDAVAYGIQGTPTVFVNDINVPNMEPNQMAARLREVIDAELQAQQ